ncbi:MAG: helix-turn-helix domain-containing protein [Clostridium sp.]|uniref:helix-turn-helix domain-containing protein n=1 Tax=Clostridium sp. TaxID=1506 RepID=UPI003F3B1554
METGISQAEISRIENDKEDVKLGKIEKIANALHVCPFDLMTCDNCENGKCKGTCSDDCVNCRRRKKKLE